MASGTSLSGYVAEHVEHHIKERDPDDGGEARSDST